MKFLAIFFLMLTAIPAFADIYDDLGRTAENRGVEKELAMKLTERTRAAGYNAETIAAVTNALNAEIGASATRVSEKVLEGIAKRVPQQAVANAALKVKARFETALEVSKQAGLKGKQAESTANIAADALAAGASETSMMKTAKKISEISQDKEKYAVAVMSLYRDMLRYRVSEAKAAEVANRSMDKLSASEINSYRHQFMTNAGTHNAESMAETMQGHMEHGDSASSMSSGSGSGHGSSGGHSGSGGGGSGGSGGSGGGHGGGGGGKH
jgi:hypothetical protein